jgi:DNA-binding CsgD family transcriptional regulator
MDGVATRRLPTEHLLRQVARECARVQDPLRLLERVGSLVRAAVPYDAAGWLLVDPETLLINGVHAESVSRELHLALIEQELGEDDVNKFYDLARRDVAAASLSAATGGDLARSSRWRTIYRPRGYGDELRAVFSAGGTVWGHACLTRAAGSPSFTAAEVNSVARSSPHVGHGIRTCLLLSAAAPDAGAVAPPALVVLTDDGTVSSMTPTARDWLGPLDDEGLTRTVVLHEVASQARVLARDGTGRPACARIRTRAGDWAVVRAALLQDAGHGGGRTALVLEPARRADVAPVLVRLHQLTDREREVTQLLLTGMPIREMAEQLWITPETLRGHVKTIFAKLGVNSRPQLAALLSGEPALSSSSSAG